MESFRISNLPVSTVIRYSSRAQKTIQPMGNRPDAAPYAAAPSRRIGGMWNASRATATAAARPANEATQAGLRLAPSRNSSVNNGSAAISAPPPKLSVIAL
jgi:hypothetical protein